MADLIEVVADTANGIQRVSAYYYEGSVVTLGFSDFYDALRSMQDGEAYHCRVTDSQYEILKDEYGVHA